MGVLAIVLAGVLAAMIQARRITELSIYQSSANTIMQGYIEQMKNMSFGNLVVSPASGTDPTSSSYVSSATTVPTQKDDVTNDPLVDSPFPVINANTLAADGTIPSGVYDNVKTFDVRAPGAADLSAHIWVWVQDFTTGGNATALKGITIIYMWQFKDGNRTRYFISSVRTHVSAVATY